MAAGTGPDGRLTPCIAGYFLVLTVLGPVVAGRAHVLVGWPRSAGRLVPGARTTAGPPGERSGGDVQAGEPAPVRGGPARPAPRGEADR
ncbi:hypothetical protein [Streptomyces sp. M92]|uniref:hypothetical protein n=1 Tax=Streptomyces sp. M92 TaxID=2944250 RepID=UPI003FA797DF